MGWLDDGARLRRSNAASQSAARDWYASPNRRAIEDAFAAVAPGDAAAAARAALALLERDDWIGGLLDPLIASLAGDDAFEPPFRVHRDALRIGAVLFDGPAVSITASILSADALATLPPPRTVVISGRMSIVRYVRGGGASMRIWRAEPIGADFAADTAARCTPVGVLPLADGVVLTQDGRTRGSLIAAATGDVVTVTATIRHGAAPLMREYAIGDGALVRTATLDDTASRTQMLLTLLRLTGRSDAAACFDAATRDGAFFLRWAAMREWLALDAAAALGRLRTMATDDPHGEVRAAAAATLPMVAARFVEAVSCPA